MAKKNSSLLPIIVIVIIVLAVGLFVFSNTKTSSSSKPQPPAAGQQAEQQQSSAPIYSPSDTRFQKCSELASRFTGQEKANFIDTCMNYLYKFCFDSSQCGPYQCTNNKCQAG